MFVLEGVYDFHPGRSFLNFQVPFSSHDRLLQWNASYTSFVSNIFSFSIHCCNFEYAYNCLFCVIIRQKKNGCIELIIGYTQSPVQLFDAAISTTETLLCSYQQARYVPRPYKIEIESTWFYSFCTLCSYTTTISIAPSISHNFQNPSPRCLLSMYSFIYVCPFRTHWSHLYWWHRWIFHPMYFDNRVIFMEAVSRTQSQIYVQFSIDWDFLPFAGPKKDFPLLEGRWELQLLCWQSRLRLLLGCHLL